MDCVSHQIYAYVQKPERYDKAVERLKEIFEKAPNVLRVLSQK